MPNCRLARLRGHRLGVSSARPVVFYKGRKVTSRVPRRRASESLGEYYPGSVDGPAEVRPVAECDLAPGRPPRRPGPGHHQPPAKIGDRPGDLRRILRRLPRNRTTIHFQVQQVQPSSSASCHVRHPPSQGRAHAGATWSLGLSGGGQRLQLGSSLRATGRLPAGQQMPQGPGCQCQWHWQHRCPKVLLY